jgi:hypothetical protein
MSGEEASAQSSMDAMLSAGGPALMLQRTFDGRCRLCRTNAPGAIRLPQTSTPRPSSARVVTRQVLTRERVANADPIHEHKP